jgi:hypothetical protein
MFRLNGKTRVEGIRISGTESCGVFASIVRSLIGNVDNSNMINFLYHFGKILEDLEVTNAISLKANGEQVWLDKENCPEDLKELVLAWDNYCKEISEKKIESINIIMEHRIGNTLFVLDFSIEGTWQNGIDFKMRTFSETQVIEEADFDKLKTAVMETEKTASEFKASFESLFYENFKTKLNLKKRARLVDINKLKDCDLKNATVINGKKYPFHPVFKKTGHLHRDPDEEYDALDYAFTYLILSEFTDAWGIESSKGMSLNPYDLKICWDKLLPSSEDEEKTQFRDQRVHEVWQEQLDTESFQDLDEDFYQCRCEDEENIDCDADDYSAAWNDYSFSSRDNSEESDYSPSDRSDHSPSYNSDNSNYTSSYVSSESSYSSCSSSSSSSNSSSCGGYGDSDD